MQKFKPKTQDKNQVQMKIAWHTKKKLQNKKNILCSKISNHQNLKLYPKHEIFKTLFTLKLISIENLTLIYL
jgi:hypothetical protein